MTPRQIHALEWALEQCRGSIDADPSQRQLYDARMAAARYSIAVAWREFRFAQAEARTKAPRRALQTYRLGVKR